MYRSRSYLWKKPRTGRKKIILPVILLLLLAVSGWIYYGINRSLASIHNHETWAQSLREEAGESELAVLVYGVDYRGAAPEVEQAVLLYYHRVEETYNAVLIPGKTALKGESKTLSDMYSREGSRGLVEGFTELTNIPVHHYLEFSYRGFISLVDRVGGVKTEELPWGKRAGLIPGTADKLDGFAFYRYLTSHGPEETLPEQLERQREALLALYQRHQSRFIITRARNLYRLTSYLETDLTWRELRDLYRDFKEVSYEDISFSVLPGDWRPVERSLLWETTEDKIEGMVEMLNSGYLVNPEEVNIRVLNGTGITGAAARMKEMLLEKGFKVPVEPDDADRTDYSTTRIISHESKREKAKAVALYVPGAVVEEDPDESRDYCVTVIVGHNLKEYEKGLPILEP